MEIESNEFDPNKFEEWETRQKEDKRVKNQKRARGLFRTIFEILIIIIAFPVLLPFWGLYWRLRTTADNPESFFHFQTKSKIIAGCILVLVFTLSLIIAFQTDPTVKLENLHNGQKISANFSLKGKVIPTTTTIVINEHLADKDRDGNFTFDYFDYRMDQSFIPENEKKYYTRGNNIIKIELDNFGRKKTIIKNVIIE